MTSSFQYLYSFGRIRKNTTAKNQRTTAAIKIICQSDIVLYRNVNRHSNTIVISLYHIIVNREIAKNHESELKFNILKEATVISLLYRDIVTTNWIFILICSEATGCLAVKDRSISASRCFRSLQICIMHATAKASRSTWFMMNSGIMFLLQ